MESTSVKVKQSIPSWHAQQQGADSILSAIVDHERILKSDLRRATTARKKLVKAVIKANRAAWSARQLALKLDAEFKQS